MKAVIVFCEGDHDVAYLYHLLKTINFNNYSEIIKNILHPLNEHFISSIKNNDFENLKIENVTPIVPKIIMKHGETLILLYALGGDKHFSKLINIFNDYNYLNINNIDNEIDFSDGNNKITEFSYFMFYDADNKGIENRISEIRKELNDFKELNHDKIICINNTKIACYIFSGENNKGTLEDILLSIMKDGNESVFTDAENFIEKHCKSNSKKKKAIIGTAGQLKKEGKSNYVIIKESGYLSPEKLLKSEKSNEIIALFENLIDECCIKRVFSDY